MRTKLFQSILFLLLTVSTIQGQSSFFDTLHIKVNGACDMCTNRIELAAIQLPGVAIAEYNLNNKVLQVIGNKNLISKVAISNAMVAVGHDTELERTTNELYNTNPQCCHYERVSLAPYTVPYLLNGTVYEVTATGHHKPLLYANLRWVGTTTGTITDEHGGFSLMTLPSTDQLIVSYVGKKTDTFTIYGNDHVNILLESVTELKVVNIVHKRKSTEISFIKPIKTLLINQAELQKAACCNLSESFETNPSVDVSFTDAVTGTRQIEMLGLAGPNVQILRESLPDIRGLSALYGFTFIPGPWIDGIQLNLGTGSVTNGFESIAGQINVELKKPNEAEKFHLNLYANRDQRFEANIIANQKINKNLYTGTMLHGLYHRNRIDHNLDGFMDVPEDVVFTGLNRWKWFGKNNYEGQAGVKFTTSEIVSGQMPFQKGETLLPVWGAEVKNNRYEAWFKSGKVFQEVKSVGFELSGMHHVQEALFGTRPYNATQSTLYSNLIYQGILKHTFHKFITGVSFLYDAADEEVNLANYSREEVVPGTYFEYAYGKDEKFTAVLGLRADYHNEFGFFATPRAHLRYAPNNLTALRFAAGRGQRSPYIFAENIGLFASNRSIQLINVNSSSLYGLEPEVAWNVGINFTQGFNIMNRAATFGADFYYTHFSNQIVVDYDEHPQMVLFYNLAGQSFSKSAQVQLDFEANNNLEVRLAYRYNDVKTDYLSGLLQKPLSSKHRAFINLAYHLEKDWQFDATFNWQGKKRLPNTLLNPPDFQLEQESNSYLVVNAQVSKSWKNDLWQVYVGGENLTGYIQENPILDADNPLGQYFDASMVWGPLYGRNVYAGLRYTLK